MGRCDKEKNKLILYVSCLSVTAATLSFSPASPMKTVVFSDASIVPFVRIQALNYLE